MIATLSGLSARFFSWWLGELAGCIPSRLREAIDPSRPALLVSSVDGCLSLQLQRRDVREDIGRISLDPTHHETARSELRDLLARATAKNAEVVILLPAGQVLRRRLVLPLAAAENLREVLSFELDKHVPFPQEQAVFDCRLVASDREAQQLTAELAVASRVLAEQASADAAELGLTGDRIDVAGPDGAPEGWNLRDRPAEASRGRRLGRLNLALGLVVLLLAVAALWLPLERRHRELAAYEAELAQARVTALEVDVLRQGIDTAVERREFLGRHRGATPPMVALLAEFTQRLSDDTWLVQLRVTRKDAALSGFSPDAAALIPALEESGMLRDARFSAPVAPDPRTGVERFNIDVALETAAGQAN